MSPFCFKKWTVVSGSDILYYFLYNEMINICKGKVYRPDHNPYT